MRCERLDIMAGCKHLRELHADKLVVRYSAFLIDGTPLQIRPSRRSGPILMGAVTIALFGVWINLAAHPGVPVLASFPPSPSNHLLLLKLRLNPQLLHLIHFRNRFFQILHEF